MEFILTLIASLALAPLTALKGQCETPEMSMLAAKKKPQLAALT
jgi:hypothetical protein